jgi:hypothetical protein
MQADAAGQVRQSPSQRLLEQGTRSTTNVALLNQSTSTSKTIGDGIFNISDRNRLGLMSSY